MPTVSLPQSHPEPEPEPDPVADRIRTLVDATAPRLFAVVEEFETATGEPDARVNAWGLAYADGSAQVASPTSELRLSLRSPERALDMVPVRHGGFGSLVWVPERQTADAR